MSKFQNFRETEGITRGKQKQPDIFFPFSSGRYTKKPKALIFRVGPNNEFIMENLSSCVIKEQVNIEHFSEPELNSAEMSFRRGWEEAIKGETEPIESLWDGIDVE